jgi:hypothetical protein
LIELEKKIDAIKEKLSNGKGRFEDGKTLVEVSLSELNELLNLAYEINNYRLNCLWNLEKTADGCKEYSQINEKYQEALKLIKGVSNGSNNPILKDINKIANEVLG